MCFASFVFICRHDNVGVICRHGIAHRMQYISRRADDGRTIIMSTVVHIVLARKKMAADTKINMATRYRRAPELTLTSVLKFQICLAEQIYDQK